MLAQRIKAVIREVKDFPKKGIGFKDITPLLLNSKLSAQIADELSKQLQAIKIDAIASIESRGFLYGMLLSQQLNIPFIPIRKKGKLPYKTISHKYDLEYGSAEIEMHIDAIKKNDRILIHDDLLATGGTAAASAELIKKQNGIIAGYAFIIELDFLKGRTLLNKYSENIISLVHY